MKIFSLPLLASAVFLTLHSISCSGRSRKPDFPRAVELLNQRDIAEFKRAVSTSPRLTKQTDGFEGRTLLHLVFSKGVFNGGLKDFADFLIRAGSDVDAQDFQGMTPAHCASFYGGGGKEALDYLTSEGADLSIKDVSGKSPLDYLNVKTSP
ncbi:hypothetical protein JIN85_04670 [Luteolibacter pohnpeiensis]|uniref:Ankyrin repeat domain-containing protein n=1 Tax=Luteolibacter pohnpeiensis TaxID=454153 RepID=A0A934S983_9BACT|nr:ankyrin repeat domain-containing protein [Luteolibacter pohnpeiensis]MBK1881694.1 hypothetical protein [Luteolibacter pohnpeiensis]